MIKVQKKNCYKAFGYKVISDIALPELTKVTFSIDEVDVSIEIGDLSKQWAEYSSPNKIFAVIDDLVMFKIPNAATYSIENGNRIIVSPMKESHEDYIRLYLLGTCMGALLLQRKILPLHGSAVVIDGKAYAIVGDSGAGKSTLASVFLSKGYQLISDDVIPVTLMEGLPTVTPAYPQQKLWMESLNEFGMESTAYRPIVDRENKFAIPVKSQFAMKSYPLGGVFELVKKDAGQIEINSIRNLNRFHTLFYHTYRNFLLSPMNLLEWHFKTTVTMLKHINVYQLVRPISGFTANNLASLILDTIRRERND